MHNLISSTTNEVCPDAVSRMHFNLEDVFDVTMEACEDLYKEDDASSTEAYSHLALADGIYTNMKGFRAFELSNLTA